MADQATTHLRVWRGDNYAWALGVPSFAPPDGLRAGGYRMAQADVDRSQEFRKCIEC